MIKAYPPSAVTSVFQIVTRDSSDIALGELVYFQDGDFGASKGLLLALTHTPQLFKKIKTTNGLWKVS